MARTHAISTCQAISDLRQKGLIRIEANSNGSNDDILRATAALRKYHRAELSPHAKFVAQRLMEVGAREAAAGAQGRWQVGPPATAADRQHGGTPPTGTSVQGHKVPSEAGRKPPFRATSIHKGQAKADKGGDARSSEGPSQPLAMCKATVTAQRIEVGGKTLKAFAATIFQELQIRRGPNGERQRKNFFAAAASCGILRVNNQVVQGSTLLKVGDVVVMRRGETFLKVCNSMTCGAAVYLLIVAVSVTAPTHNHPLRALGMFSFTASPLFNPCEGDLVCQATRCGVVCAVARPPLPPLPATPPSAPCDTARTLAVVGWPSAAEEISLPSN